MSKSKVMVAVLTGIERQNWLNSNLVMNLVAMARDTRFDVYFFPVVDARPTDTARNLAIHAARQHNVDWLICLDNDNFFHSNPLDILASAGPNQHVIGLAYTVGTPQHGYEMLPRTESQKKGDIFHEVKILCGGVLMIHKSVWQKISKGPWFHYVHDQNELLSPGPNTRCEDVYFAELVRQNGLKCWIHESLAGHYRTTDVTAMLFNLTNQAQQIEQARQTEYARQLEQIRQHGSNAGTSVFGAR